MKEWIEFLTTYPMWVKVSIGLLVGAMAILLIAFRPPAASPKSGQAGPAHQAVEPEAPRVGTRVVLDISDGQEQWNGLTAWAAASEPAVAPFNKAFEAKSFSGDEPGVLILPLPHHKLLAESKVKVMKHWVEQGGGLLVLGYYAADTHHGTNISRLTREWGISFAEDLLMPPGAEPRDTRRQVFSSAPELAVQVPIPPGARETSKDQIVRGVDRIVLMSAASLRLEHATMPLTTRLDTPSDTQVWRPEGPVKPDGMRPLIEDWRPLERASVPVLVAFKAGRGKVALVGSWKLATMDYGDNRQLMKNLIAWLRP